MRVVHQGKAPKKYPWIGRYLCAWCKSVIDLHESDAPSVLTWDESQLEGMSVNVECPVCKQERSLMEFTYTTTYTGDRAKWDAVPFGDAE